MLRINDGVIPWWLFDAGSRAARHTVGEFIAMAQLLIPTGQADRRSDRLRGAGL